MSAKRKPRPEPPTTPAAEPPPTAGIIPTLDLLAVLAHRRTVAELSDQLRTAAARLAEAEDHVMRLHAAGAVPADPRFLVAVSREDGAISPRWKVEYITHMAEAHALSPVAAEEEVRKRYAPNVSTTLVIEQKGVTP